MKISVSNDFHNTSANIFLKHGGKLTPAQIKLCKIRLCGKEDCTCGSDFLGAKGVQNHLLSFRLLPDGSAEIF